jgi:hypothetical protein
MSFYRTFHDLVFLNVSAKDKGTGKENKITISGSSGLSDAEIEKMVQEAEANKEADAKKKAVIEVRNQADALLHSTKKTLEENKITISASLSPDEPEIVILFSFPVPLSFADTFKTPFASISNVTSI